MVGLKIIFMFSCGFIFRVVAPLYFVELDSFVVGYPIFLVKDLDEVFRVSEVGLQQFNIIDHHILGHFQAPLQL